LFRGKQGRGHAPHLVQIHVQSQFHAGGCRGARRGERLSI
jgi:hypothetical protein